MGDKVIITDDEPKAPDVVVVAAEEKPKVEKVVTEKVTTVETKQS